MIFDDADVSAGVGAGAGGFAIIIIICVTFVGFLVIAVYFLSK